MHRFFVDRRSLSDNTVRISGEDSRHICRVLRLHEGDMIRLCDGEGMDYEGVIEKIYENSVVVAVKRSFPSSSEPQTKVVLYQAVPKGTKMDIIIQKCVELGVYRIVPVITARTIVKLESEKDANKKQPAGSNSQEAARQSRRDYTTSISAIGLDNAIQSCSDMFRILPGK